MDTSPRLVWHPFAFVESTMHNTSLSPVTESTSPSSVVASSPSFQSHAREWTVTIDVLDRGVLYPLWRRHVPFHCSTVAGREYSVWQVQPRRDQPQYTDHRYSRPSQAAANETALSTSA